MNRQTPLLGYPRIRKRIRPLFDSLDRQMQKLCVIRVRGRLGRMQMLNYFVYTISLLSAREST